MLIDDVTITVKAGNGGKGSVHFLKNAMTTRGGPDGGNGGNGGNIYFQGVNDILGLAQFQYRKEITAENGIDGGQNNLYGRNARHTTMLIPIGTLITDQTTNEQWETENDTEKIILALGGKGGKGNKEFATPTDQAPHFAEKGSPGQRRLLHLILRIIADVGFIGLPNAGKSSLLKSLTNAKPKIGNYPFTTLEPNLGVLQTETQNIILADIPGLIDGASRGKGLGIKFLRHVEKTKIIAHCIDSTSENVVRDYETVQKELTAYSELLSKKHEIILLTKIDLINRIALRKKFKELQKIGRKVFTVSVYNQESLQNLRQVLQKK